MTYRRLLFIFVISCKQSVNGRVVIYLLIVIHYLRRYSRVYFIFAPEIFIPDVYDTKNRHRIPAPENGANLWRRFLERVMDITLQKVLRTFYADDATTLAIS